MNNITIPPLPVTVLGCDLKCPGLTLSCDTAAQVLPKLECSAFEGTLSAAGYLCPAVGYAPFRYAVEEALDDTTLEVHFARQSYAFREAWAPLDDCGYLHATRLAWAQHIAEHIRAALAEKE